MTVEPGWYYAEGDPPGTVRRWNGTEWIGFPVEPPRTEEELAAPNPINTPRFEPVQGQVPLRPIAIVVQIALVGAAIASLLLSIALLGLAPQAGPDPSAPLITGEVEADAGLFGFAVIASSLTQLVTGVVFVVWFYLAYRNVSLWHHTRRGVAWTIFAWFVPFMNLFRPMTMMLEVVENSGSKARQENPSPVPVIAWWFLWVFSQFGIFFVAFGTDDIEDLGRNLVLASGVQTLLSVVAAGFAIYIVQTVTTAQDRRRKPTAAQVELMRQEAELTAFRHSQSTGINYG